VRRTCRTTYHRAERSGRRKSSTIPLHLQARRCFWRPPLRRSSHVSESNRAVDKFLPRQGGAGAARDPVGSLRVRSSLAPKRLRPCRISTLCLFGVRKPPKLRRVPPLLPERTPILRLASAAISGTLEDKSRAAAEEARARGWQVFTHLTACFGPLFRAVQAIAAVAPARQDIAVVVQLPSIARVHTGRPDAPPEMRV